MASVVSWERLKVLDALLDDVNSCRCLAKMNSAPPAKHSAPTSDASLVARVNAEISDNSTHVEVIYNINGKQCFYTENIAI